MKMLNISKVSVNDQIDQTRFKSFQQLETRNVSSLMIKIIILLLILLIASMFLPWTQNIRSDGYVTTLNPYDKPQSIQSLIDGKIQLWYVQEGDTVAVGDTIIRITEVKSEYLDPDLLKTTENQVDAKRQSAEVYLVKADRLDEQYDATLANVEVKLKQNNIKINQVLTKIMADSMSLNATKVKLENSKKQLDRIRQLHEKGIKSLTELEIKTLSFQEAQAYVGVIENKILASKNELTNLETNKNSIQNEFDQKLAKIRADQMSSYSESYKSTGDMNKLQSQLNQYQVRAQATYITSPVSGVITKAIRIGVGELIKSGEDIISIVPTNFEPAIELFARPRDMPLIKKGQSVRIQFDGWPAVVFSGWPNNSFGTFGGKIFAIDNFISDNGLYRILVNQDPDQENWPSEVRMGGGANGLLMLNDVKLYYEIWRVMNGFPPDYYEMDSYKRSKLKAPIKKIK